MELTEEQAIELCKSGFWENLTPEERCKFQLYTRRLCMPWDVFRAAIDQTLGRSVFTHEFGLRFKELQEEFEGKRGKPTLDDLLNCIPANIKKMIVLVD
ncbi:MAG: hypothetical protein ACFFD4_08085 [Candidatus Odinarchaeota archaeon]